MEWHGFWTDSNDGMDETWEHTVDGPAKSESPADTVGGKHPIIF